MSKNPVWINKVERDAWVECHCAHCFQPDQALKRVTGKGDGCPLLASADNNRLPTQWTRRRNAVMGDTYKCSEYLKQPPVNRRAKSAEQPEPMIQVEPDDYNLVPVDGWPDYRAEARKKEPDHQ